jgi:Bacterial archaeo-eukaryotic release factor family 11
LKPLLRAITFPHAGFVLALSQNGAWLVGFAGDSPPVRVRVDDMPRDAASAAGKSSINDRSPFGRIQGSEGKNVRLTQYARKVDSALRPCRMEPSTRSWWISTVGPRLSGRSVRPQHARRAR